MARVAELVAELSLSTARLQADVGKATRIMSQGMKSMADSVNFLKNSLASVVSVGALVALGKSAIDVGSQLSDMSKKFGVSAEELSQLSYVGKMVGVELEDMGNGFKFLSKAISEAQEPTSDAALAFRLLGVNTKDASGNLKSTNQVFDEVADAFSGLSDGANKTALALAILGRAGANMLPMFEKGAQGIKETKAEAVALGIALNDVEIKRLDDIGDAIDRLYMRAKATAGRGLVELVDNLKAMAAALAYTGAPFEQPGPGAVRYRIPPPEITGPPKRDAASLAAEKKRAEEAKKAAEGTKKAAEDAKKEKDRLDKEYLQLHVKNIAEEGRLVHDALAAEMGMDQEYFDTLTKMRMDDFADWKKLQDDVLKLDVEHYAKEGEIIHDALAAEMGYGDKAPEPYPFKDALTVAKTVGDISLAIQQMNSALGEQYMALANGQSAIQSYANVWMTAGQSIKSIMFDIADTAVTKLSDSIAELVVRGKADFRELANSMIQEMVRMTVASKIVAPLMQGIMGYFGGPAAAGVTSLSGGSYSLGGNYSLGSGKAGGGPVSPGMLYPVGERGIELFAPSVPGTIIPNGGKGPITINIKNDTGQPVAAHTARASFDANGYIIDVVLDGLSRNVHGLRTALGGA